MRAPQCGAKKRQVSRSCVPGRADKGQCPLHRKNSEFGIESLVRSLPSDQNLMLNSEFLSEKTARICTEASA